MGVKDNHAAVKRLSGNSLDMTEDNHMSSAPTPGDATAAPLATRICVASDSHTAMGAVPAPPLSVNFTFLLNRQPCPAINPLYFKHLLKGYKYCLSLHWGGPSINDKRIFS